jgi:hypothetical protein
VAPPKTSGMAVTSVVLGVISLLFVPLAPVAIILGHIAHARIKKAGGSPGVATAGFVIGYCAFILGAVIIGLAFPTYKLILQRAQVMRIQTEMRSVATAIGQYHTEYNRFPVAPNSGDTADMPAFPTDSSSALLDALLGSSPELNPRQIKFVDLPTTKDGRFGLVTGSGNTEWVDFWGTPYAVILDTNYDGKIANPDSENADPKIKAAALPELQAQILIYSCGPDKEAHTKDDVVSWRTP